VASRPIYIVLTDSTPRVLTTISVKTPSRDHEISCRKKFTSDSLRLQQIKLHHPEHLQVACQKNLTIGSSPRRVELTQHREFNATKHSVEDLDPFPYLKHVENVTDLESQSQPPLPRTEIYPGTSAPPIDYIA